MNAATAAGGLRAWESSAMDRLALVIVIDQFIRNVFRGQGQAFAGDLRAQALVEAGSTDAEIAQALAAEFNWGGPGPAAANVTGMQAEFGQ